MQGFPGGSAGQCGIPSWVAALTCAGEVVHPCVSRGAVAAVGAGQVDAHGVGVAVMHLGCTLINVCRGGTHRELTVRLSKMNNITSQKKKFRLQLRKQSV